MLRRAGALPRALRAPSSPAWCCCSCALPASFLPSEDQGYIIVNVQLPPGATQDRTLAVIKQVEAYISSSPKSRAWSSVLGFSFSGQGQNAGLAFVTLKDWDERKGAEHSAAGDRRAAPSARSRSMRDAFIFPLSPPPIPELGTATGFTFRLQDRGGLGHDSADRGAQPVARHGRARARCSRGVRPDGLEDAPQLQLDIDRDKANALGVTFDAINTTLSTALGSAYSTTSPTPGAAARGGAGRRAVAHAAGGPAALNAINSQRPAGAAVGLRHDALDHRPAPDVRYNGYPAMRISGDAAPGYSTGDAMARDGKAGGATAAPASATNGPGQSREEKLSGSHAPILLGFSLLAVFLCLAALYESWSIPLAVMLVVPLGVLGALLAR